MPDVSLAQMIETIRAAQHRHKQAYTTVLARMPSGQKARCARRVTLGPE